MRLNRTLTLRKLYLNIKSEPWTLTFSENEIKMNLPIQKKIEKRIKRTNGNCTRSNRWKDLVEKIVNQTTFHTA